jgi:Mrp family chromosome partitioning ATPase
MRRFAARAAWTSARASNALRRPAAIIVTGATLSVIVLALLLLVPGRATRASSEAVAQIPERPDSLPPLEIRSAALGSIATADSLLEIARREAAVPEPQIIDTIPPHLIPRREELANAISALTSLMNRAASAPLPSSYRALGEAPVMQGVPGVPALLDSLAVIEREREAFGAVSGADPLYIAFTARANAVGRSIVAAAEQRRSALRAELAPLLPQRPPPRQVVVVDTLPVLAEREEARRVLVGAEEELARIRARNAQIDELERRAMQLSEVGASLSATVTAALVVGLALGFALVLLAEMRKPRVSNRREAERVGGARVMAVVEPRAFVAERDRRRSDVALPEHIEPFAEHYRQIYLHLTGREEPLTTVTVTGDEPDVAAVVATNLAAFNVREARSAIVVDTDPLSASVSRALHVPSEPGLSDVLSGTAAWPDAMQYVTLGRDQVLAVMPSGRRSGQPSPDRAERVRSELSRLSARHDLIVFTAALEQARRHPTTVLLSSDIVLCVRIGHTRIKELRAMAVELREAGMTVHGIVLWDAEPPGLVKERIVSRRTPRAVEAAEV